ncbi:hypothetical protein [Dictyobacter aurantiacus]|uniref:Uncharacterized protein n=1 Tax=Dictyobacter aurantiacus TaxID=1936993 RepID=A0A401ZD50_9CHLR|nr:hypothetical protein [Dictyobacter aurantiacus]GCE04775.1 hypothetical protein KDAU_21040 [Dictyobacter aurantiacus]
MRMNLRQFMVFVCDVMVCVWMFSAFMQQTPTPGAWAILSFCAFLVLIGIGIYLFANFMIEAILD